MKYPMNWVAIFALIISLSSTTQADTTAMAVTHVYAGILPYVTIGTSSGSVNSGGPNSACPGYAGSKDGICWSSNNNLGDHMPAPVHGTFTFFVEANVQQIEFSCGATDLFKGGITMDITPGNSHDDPIPLDKDYGCTISMDGAMPQGGNTPTASFAGGLSDLLQGIQSEWVVWKTNAINFHANFPEPSRNVSIDLRWNHTNPEQRIGEYSGFVKLYAMIPIGAIPK